MKDFELLSNEDLKNTKGGMIDKVIFEDIFPEEDRSKY